MLTFCIFAVFFSFITLKTSRDTKTTHINIMRWIGTARWNFLGLCELRWNNFGETTTEEGHKLYYNGEGNMHEYGVGFLVHKDIMKSVVGCRPISSRLIFTRPRADPFNITVIHVYAPTTGYSDDQIEDFYSQLRRIIDQAPKKDILIVQGDWNAKFGKNT